MLDSKPLNETPFRNKSDMITRPFKTDVLHNHIYETIDSGYFKQHPSQSDPDLERFKFDSDATTLKRCSLYVTKLLPSSTERIGHV
jgi:hypothetical protein